MSSYSSLSSFGMPNYLDFNTPAVAAPNNYGYSPTVGATMSFDPSMGGSYAPVSDAVGRAVNPAAAGLFSGLDGWTQQNLGIPLFGQTNAQGMKQMGAADYGLGALSAGLNAFIGMKQYGLAKKQFEFQKDAWNKDFTANANLTNSRLADRQDRRVAEAGNMAAWTGASANPRSTADYMAQYGVKTNG